MTNAQPEPERRPVHPEMLAGIPEKWRDALAEFMTTGKTDADGFDAFLESSEAAQSAVDAAFQAHLRAAAQEHLERVERTGGRFQAAESLADQK